MMAVHLLPGQIDAYLDGELQSADRSAIDTHLAGCPKCRASLEDRQRLVSLIQSGKFAEPVSEALRERINVILQQKKAKETSKWSDRWRWPLAEVGWHTWAAAALAVCGLSAALGWAILTHAHAGSADAFVQAAVNAHTRRLRGNLPLQIETDSARQLTRWFGPQVAFPFRLPQYEKNGNEPTTYQTLGGSVVPFRGHHAAFVAYRMQNGQPVSLLVTSADQAIAQGGSVVVERSLSFHNVKRENLAIVTWTVHGVTYALVSGLDLPPKQSCLVCHSGTTPSNKKPILAVHAARTFPPSTNCESVSQNTFMPGLLAY